MKKILLTSALLSSVFVSYAEAQNYNPNYNYQYNNYNASQAQRDAVTDSFKKFSIGFDYVLGSASIVDESFSIASPLPGGEIYNGSTDQFEDSINSLNFNLGYRPFRYLGFEAFYQHSLSDNQTKYQESYASDPRFALAEYNMKYSAYGLDAIVYVPLFEKMELLGSVGVAKYDFTADADLTRYNISSNNPISKNTLSFDDSKTAFRYGGGAQVWLSQRLAFRAMYRFTSIGGDYIDDISEVSLGLRYNF